MNIIVVNPVGKGLRFIDRGGWSVGPAGSLDVTDAVGRRFITVAPGAWSGVQDETELRNHESGITGIGNGGNSARN